MTELSSMARLTPPPNNEPAHYRVLEFAVIRASFSLSSRQCGGESSPPHLTEAATRCGAK